MKLKTFDVTVDGKTITVAALGEKNLPVWVADDGKEIEYDAVASNATISRLNSEAKNHREAKEAAETRLKAFEGIEDAEAAKKALQTVADLDSGALTTAAKVEEMRTSITKAAEDKLAGVIKAKDDEIKSQGDQIAKLSTTLDTEIVGGAFGRSKFIADKLIIPPEIAQAYFGAHFTREEGQLVAKDAQGVQIFSRADPSRPADFDEALEVIVNSYGRKDTILKGTVSGGGGAPPGGGAGAGGKTMTRSEFSKLPPIEQTKVATSGTQIVDG